MFLFTRQLLKVAAFDGPGISQSSTTADKEVGREVDDGRRILLASLLLVIKLSILLSMRSELLTETEESSLFTILLFLAKSFHFLGISNVFRSPFHQAPKLFFLHNLCGKLSSQRIFCIVRFVYAIS